jgi:translation initiation factor IF-2
MIGKKEERRRELEQQKQLNIFVDNIVYQVLEDAKCWKKSKIDYSKRQLTHTIDTVVEALKLRFPDSIFTVESTELNHTIIIDWS